MNINRLDAAEVEIERLQEAISKVRLDHASQSEFYFKQPIDHRNYFNPSFAATSKHTGAVKRASMDLSRALTELRRPD